MLVCEQCGEHFPRVEGKRGRQAKYCGSACRERANRRRNVRRCFYCREPLDPLSSTIVNLNFCNSACWNGWVDNDYQRAVVVRHCVECGVDFEPRSWQQEVCASDECKRSRASRLARERHRAKMAAKPPTRSQTCGWCGGEIVVSQSAPKAKRYHPECKADARRAHYRRKNVLRQGVGQTTRFRLGELGERDGWRCALCGGQVLESLSGMHPDGPTVDHIVPLSRGGWDGWDNVQLAHRRCNVAKGNRSE